MLLNSLNFCKNTIFFDKYVNYRPKIKKMISDKLLLSKFEKRITCFKSKHNVLSQPLTRDELLEVATKSSRLKVSLRVSMDELFGDIDEFNDQVIDRIVSEDSGMTLTDISYKSVGAKGGDIIVRVDSNLEKM